MPEFLRKLFEADFMPHGHCYFWQPDVVWLHVLSDLLIALSYFSIPAMLFYFVRKRRDLPFHWMFLLFGAFIIACGSTHVMEVYTLWVPMYRLSGLLKLATGLISGITAVLLLPLIPKAVSLPSPEHLARLNQELQNEILERKAVEQKLASEAAVLREQAQLLDLAYDAIFVREMDGSIRFYNHGAEEMYGWSRQEAAGKKSHE